MRRAVGSRRRKRSSGLSARIPSSAGRAAGQGELTPGFRARAERRRARPVLAEEFARLTDSTGAVCRRFGFPFIIAVRGHTRASAIASLEERLRHTPDEERAEALRQIDRIASLRLGGRFT